jgi:hypothetical protein
MVDQAEGRVESDGAHGDGAALPAGVIAAKGALPMHGRRSDFRSSSLLKRG